MQRARRRLLPVRVLAVRQAVPLVGVLALRQSLRGVQLVQPAVVLYCVSLY